MPDTPELPHSGSPSPSVRREPRSRFKPQARAGLRLEERDLQLLCDLFLHRAMSREQIQRLHFTSLVRCNARLRQLFDHKLVSRFYPPAAPFGVQAIYSVGRAALPFVARRLEMELPDVVRLARGSYTPTFLEHTLAVVEIYLAFYRATAEHPDVGLERWLAEFQCYHEWEIRPTQGSGLTQGGKWRKEAFKPDGFVRLTHDGRYLNYFLEADLGHTSSRQFLGKLLTHQRYAESGLFAQTYGSPDFITLVVTTSPRRVQNLKALVEAHHSRLFWLTTFEQMSSHGVLYPIWQVPSQTGARSPIIGSTAPEDTGGGFDNQ